MFQISHHSQILATICKSLFYLICVAVDQLWRQPLNRSVFQRTWQLFFFKILNTFCREISKHSLSNCHTWHVYRSGYGHIIHVLLRHVLKFQFGPPEESIKECRDGIYLTSTRLSLQWRDRTFSFEFTCRSKWISIEWSYLVDYPQIMSADQ